MKGTYLLVNLATIFFPLIFSFHPRLQFYKVWPAFFPAMIATAVFFICWDALFTLYGVWGFNDAYVLGIYWFTLPLEEILFFICIPYACVFTYHCLNILVKRDVLLHVKNVISVVLTVILLVTAILLRDRIYTCLTFLLLPAAIFLFRKSSFLSGFYFSYLVLLFPFMMVNGILTGSLIHEEVVWYNEQEIIGARIFTIPVEDIFYGMLLVLLNIAGMEYLLSRKKRKE